MRLAFSVAIMVEPDVLLIDEVLAVGDSAFQQKCMEQLIKLKTKGTTIVFVSHDLGAMKRLCDRVIWIHDSKIVSDGKPKDTIDKYLEFLGEEENKRLLGEKHSSQEEESSKIGLDSPLITDNKIKIMNVRLTNEIGEEKISFMSGDTACIKINYRAITKVNNPIFSLTISNLEGITCYSTSTLIDHLNIAEIVSDEIGSIQFYIPSLDLVANTYLISASILNESGYVYDVFEEGTALKVSSLSEDVGIVKLKHAWKLERG
ncbi:Wzt carbohydrate-binding domain-containing protein [Cohnella ginsengisoli]|uniref:Wzt carbohydrate-binding domain-containing protein n=1 Tax=Cohnella ginsengisoli TaxID=425004 RepID=A0A9X4KM06_9BACL|nr:Wzt carbohydrate-binding domain-containing protein [Cohnella ginsengisoli]MDG0794528.1 Wzt carbohydrate-binding domain-containing protein [Cohnella ginsengisoli]